MFEPQMATRRQMSWFLACFHPCQWAFVLAFTIWCYGRQRYMQCQRREHSTSGCCPWLRSRTVGWQSADSRPTNAQLLVDKILTANCRPTLGWQTANSQTGFFWELFFTITQKCLCILKSCLLSWCSTKFLEPAKRKLICLRGIKYLLMILFKTYSCSCLIICLEWFYSNWCRISLVQ